ncbi:MAG: hypothetical protein A3B74_01935 [Candidatus Kerfeldbacteria bacterium RIFCSPHIGHO2_02_FULL_42_14]|uniref:Uncharacterized protein n=1 Tax=Candidatus Kerfeldbacteria bacterium RIFCSPHIGHO2_02_FULL_42_14 TaxID=1798540 RepID=A0A1G2APG2_9BACT|nr:MAG: hypothetical protein A3B74_01935 [Candidatus Kerfeldbacteria bacterium RIFCSPHIGHO2_02_FULL_42_14]OGY81781.1 MAG: hypothetical protein A3E60_00510 [Candidatus Kerfeldbacteria bacterium RIFCSPHIGHO2_12_FULL_42_13]OGY84470.1 MAG: hypothetical protein A3I91_00125 [Candidatus Kerfeldbacteria bacterium RIFCSPLOWO2_02_FULL_42_19]OGY87990.1 MAG: hypothetical protein A3G01_04205 [Candidatus Kerfeldbacteria bacterium RIFCSPLOWO2_12_FULL_43_9]
MNFGDLTFPMRLSPNVISCAMRIEKEEEDSRFRSTDSAQCAEKGEYFSSFSMIKSMFHG